MLRKGDVWDIGVYMCVTEKAIRLFICKCHMSTSHCVPCKGVALQYILYSDLHPRSKLCKFLPKKDFHGIALGLRL